MEKKCFKSASGKIIPAIVSVFLVLFFIAVPVGAVGTDNYLIIYCIGADLEDMDSYATQNIFELLPNLDPKKTELLVFYGAGGNHPGWNSGISVADYASLKKDMDDGGKHLGQDKDGNATSFVIDKLNVDTNSKAGLTEAIKYANKYAKEKGISTLPRSIILWDHGGGFDGYGTINTNYGSGNRISNNEMKSALSTSDKKFSLIFFDCCLMSSLETAYELKDSGKYIIASEENIPGDGNNYKAIGQAFSTTSDSLSQGKIIIDGYFDKYSLDKGETLSLIDLEKIDNLVSSIDNLGAILTPIVSDNTSMKNLGLIYRNIYTYGANNGDPYGTGGNSYDLGEFVTSLVRNGEGNLKNAAENVLKAEKDAVLLEKHGRIASNSTGISLGSAYDINEKIDSRLTLTGKGWADFLMAYYNALTNDSNNSVSLGNSAGVTPVAETAKSDSVASVTLNNTNGQEIVMMDFLLDKGDGNFIILGQDKAEEGKVVSDSPYWQYEPTGTYTYKGDTDWNGDWYILDNGTNTSLLTLNYDSEFTDNNEKYVVYASEGTLSRKGETLDSFLMTSINSQTGKVDDIYVVSKSSDNQDNGRNKWGNGTIYAGDIFTPKLDIYNEKTNTFSTEIGTPFIFSDNPINDLVLHNFDKEDYAWMFETYTISNPNNTNAINTPQTIPAQTTSAKSPFPILGILAALGTAGIFVVRRKH